MVVHTFNPKKDRHFLGFEASLVYVLSSRTVRAI